MSSSTLRLNPSAVEARQELAEGRERLKLQHRAGSLGIQLCANLADLMDSVVLRIFQSAVDSPDVPSTLQAQIALVPHGGYGRRDVAPFSDVDLMLLHHPSVASEVATLAQRLVRDLCDVGLDLGFSMRTPQQACQMAATDPIIFTSLVESRFLAGSDSLFAKFVQRFRRVGRWHKPLVRAIEESRRQERVKYGETVYLLQPNLKRSRGGLRDIHLLRWVGFARFGEAEPENLRRMGHLSAEDQGKLRAAVAFLLKVRNEMHFHAGAAQDVLYRHEQLRLAELYNYPGTEAVLPVERFMQEYFRHTSDVRKIVAHFVSAAKWHSPGALALHNFWGHYIEGDYIAGPLYISSTRRGRRKLQGNLEEVLRLMDVSNRYNKRIDHNTWQIIRESMMSKEVGEISAEAAHHFLSLLSQPGRLGKLLRRLHELRVLEKLVPGFDHARCLLQFNEYHKYTVDEHSIRAVEHATEFAWDDGLLGKVYRRIKDKTTLHLALLTHDLGKGYAEDHSEVGRRIALQVAEHLRLPAGEAERLCFLVHRHLMLNHLAFRRDNSDEAVIVEAAAEIGSPENLRMMFVLACADLAAVGPGVLNQWKIEVLGDLHRRIMDKLSGGTPSADFEQRVAPQRDELLAAVENHADSVWLKRQIYALPPAYLNGASADQVLDDLQRLRDMPQKNAVAWGRYLPKQDIVEYSIGVDESISEGIFHRLTGALTSQGLEILSAEIHSLADSLILDRFCVRDPDFQGEPPEDRFTQVSQRLVASLQDNAPDQPTFRRVWNRGRVQSTATLTNLQTRVLIDNNTSERFTIIDVFAHDRTGLLYAIARTLYELQLSVQTAKIGTYLDQVVDVFYVTNLAGEKVQEEARLEEIRSRMYDAIEAWEKAQTEHARQS